MMLDSKYVMFLTLSCVVVAALMSLYKTTYHLATKKSTNKTVNQLVAWVFSFLATVLCWWCIGVPGEFKQVFIYMFVVYVLQMKLDLNCIKKLINKKINTVSDKA